MSINKTKMIEEKIGSNTFCVLPWIHLATRPNGDVRLCCAANASGAGLNEVKDSGLVKENGVNMNLREHTIEQVWNSEHMRDVRKQMLNNEVPTSCTKCFKEEEAGIISKRQWEINVWNDRLNIIDLVSQTNNGAIPVDIPYFDLRLGNTCQLKCIMCSPHDSSSWIKEWKIQYPKYKTVALKQDQSWDRSFDYTWYKKGTFLDSMKNQSTQIKELYFAGGEPLLIPEHYSILEFMVNTDAAKNCVLRYNSNGLELSEKLFELWSHFKEVKFNFSIDAVGARNDYIRYPSNWDNVVNNLKILDDSPKNITVNIACAVQLLNASNLVELAKWKEGMNFKKINLPPYGAGIIGTHLVYLPSYLNVRVLPKHIKSDITNKIEEFCKSRTDNEFFNNPYGLQRWLGLIKYMNQEDWTAKIPMLLDYLNTTDQTRKTNFRTVFPELNSL